MTNPMKLTRTVLLATGLTMTLGCLPVAQAVAAEPLKLTLTLREHHFIPRQITAPAGVPLEITLINTDGTAEEFESKQLRVEKIVAGGASIVIKLRPLVAGQYIFFGDYNSATARGALVVTGAP
jgi:hypothetical protein